MTTNYIQAISPGPKWTFLRTIDADPAPGTFVAETDWAGGGTVPAFAQCVPVGNTTPGEELDLGTVLFYAVLTTADAVAIVARGSMSFDLQALEVVDRERQRPVPGQVLVPEHAVDSAVISMIPQRKIAFVGRGIDRLAFRLSNFASVPGTAAEIHIFYRLE